MPVKKLAGWSIFLSKALIRRIIICIKTCHHTLEFWPCGTDGEWDFFNTTDFYQMILIRDASGVITVYINMQEFATYDDAMPPRVLFPASLSSTWTGPRGIFQASIPEKMLNCQYSVPDALGRPVITGGLPEPIQMPDLRFLQPGIYLFIIDSGSETVSLKLFRR